MNQLQLFSNGNVDLPIRIKENGEIEFDAAQSAIGFGICRIAESGNTVVRWERVRKYLLCPQVGTGDFITEPQFYKLAIKANNETAEKFQDWVTEDVLPAIRRNGAYMTNEKAYAITHNKDALADMLLQAGNQLKAAKVKIEADRPKVLFADSVSASNSTILIGDLAKVLRGNGVNVGQNRLFQILRKEGYLISRKGVSYNMPTQKAMELRLFRIKETSITHADGHVTINKTPKVTGKGQQYFINKFLEGEINE